MLTEFNKVCHQVGLVRSFHEGEEKRWFGMIGGFVLIGADDPRISFPAGYWLEHTDQFEFGTPWMPLRELITLAMLASWLGYQVQNMIVADMVTGNEAPGGDSAMSETQTEQWMEELKGVNLDPTRYDQDSPPAAPSS